MARITFFRYKLSSRKRRQIIHKHKPKDFAGQPYARVRLVSGPPHGVVVFVPLRWFQKPNHVLKNWRNGINDEEMICFWSPNLRDTPNFNNEPELHFFYYAFDENSTYVMQVIIERLYDIPDKPSQAQQIITQANDGPIIGKNLHRITDEGQRFQQALRNGTVESSQTRMEALKVLVAILSKGDRSELVDKHQTELCELVDRSMSKRNASNAREQVLALHLFALLVGLQKLQSKHWQTSWTGRMLELANNGSINEAVRAQCCSSLAICTKVGENRFSDDVDVLKRMDILFGIVQDATNGADIRSAALRAWTLLSTELSRDICEITFRHLLKLLKSDSDLIIRQNAAEALAVLAESTAEAVEQHITEITDSLESELESGAHKTIVRPNQRATFRKLLTFFSTDEQFDEERITLSKNSQKQIVLRTWTQRAMYETLVECTGSGLLEYLDAKDEHILEALQMNGDDALVDHAYRVNRDAYRARSSQTKTVGIKKRLHNPRVWDNDENAIY